MPDSWADVVGKHSNKVQAVTFMLLVVAATAVTLATLAFAKENPDRSVDAVFGLFRISARPDPSVEKCKIIAEAKERAVDSMAGQIVSLIQVERESALKVAELRLKFLNENIQASDKFWSADQKYSYALSDQEKEFSMHVQDRKKAQEQQRVLMDESQALSKSCGVP